MKFSSVLLLCASSLFLNCCEARQAQSLKGLQKLARQKNDILPVEDLLVPMEPDFMTKQRIIVGKDANSTDERLEVPTEVEIPPEVEVPSEFEVDVKNSDGCHIKVQNLKNPQPLFVKPGTGSFYPFNDTGYIEVAAGGIIEFHCSSEFVEPLPYGQTVTATCVSGQVFNINGVLFNMSQIKCKFWPYFNATKSGETCNGGTTLIKVGFALNATRFLTQMEICFNEIEQVTRYVFHKLEPGANYYQWGVPRIQFETDGYFGGKNVDRLYTQVAQKKTINRELGGNAVYKFFNEKRDLFLARGHLGAKADFVYGSQQRATFLFINAAPQWQVFNAGNWQKVEDGVRAWVSQRRMFVHCYTGVYGVTTLPNDKGEETPMYLSYDHNHNGEIPVPKLYFRVVIEPSTRRGIVLIGVNNPHLTLQQIERDYIICPDVSDKITWLNWKKTDISAGYSYACEVHTFTQVVKDLPALTVASLLY